MKSDFPEVGTPNWDISTREEAPSRAFTGMLSVLPSEWVSFAFNFFDPVQKDYVPFPFANRSYLKDIYDCGRRKRLLIFGRQSEKSTLLANVSLSYCCLYRHFHVLYVAPTSDHIKRFSKDRLDDTISISPRLKGFTDKKIAANVKEKGFVNNSRFILRSCYTKPDSVRGIPADLLLIDEIATIITDHIPIIELCLSHSPYRFRIFSGTPLSVEGASGYYWQHSTQNEWAVPCYAHSPAYFNILTKANIGKECLICDKCGKPINAWDAGSRWVSMNKGSDFEGFRVPQIMVPSVDWQEIIFQMENYPTHKFKNEVMAEFSDAGTRPITKRELMRCCTPTIKMDDDYLATIEQISAGFPCYAGCDWGSGDPSYTVLSLGSYFGSEKFKIFYMHRFDGPEADPVRQLSMIMSQLRKFNIRVVGLDWGFGFYQNAKLAESLAEREVLSMQFYYSLNPSRRFYYSRGTGKYILHRTQIMSSLFSIMKAGEIELPCKEKFEHPFADNILNISAVFNEAVRMLQYEHPMDKPDDSFHSILYCFLASIMDHPRPDLLGFHGVPILQ
jgi:hypothetical protein